MNRYYTHNKTGNRYRVLAYATDCTDERDGNGMVVYCKDDNEHDIFVRDCDEFERKFTPIEAK